MASHVDQGRVPDVEPIQVELLLSPSPAERHRLLLRQLAERYHELEPATRAEFARKHLFRAPDELFQKVEAFARQSGLTLTERNELPSRVTLSGTAGRMARAFKVELHRFSVGSSSHIAPAQGSTLSLPPGIAENVVGVLGLEQPPSILPLRLPANLPEDGADTLQVRAPAPAPAPGFITVPELAKLYNFPAGLDGSGQKLGVIIPYGGLDQSALDTYFQCLGLRPRKVEIVELEGAKNKPSSPDQLGSFLIETGFGSGPHPLACRGLDTGTEPTPHEPTPYNVDDLPLQFTLEAILDTELLGSVANGAELLLYRTPFDIPGIREAIERAAEDGVDVLVMSWGSAEGTAGQNYIDAIDATLAFAVLVHDMTILCASGDHGSTPSSIKLYEPQVVFPASSCWVVACGGTTLQVTDSGTVSEEVWNEQDVPAFGHLATGGGYSRAFARPGWQTGNSDTMRGVPDLSMNAAFATGLWGWFGKANGVAMGTSASAPLLGGLVALINQGLGRRVGLLSSLLYDDRVRASMRRLSRRAHNSIHQSVDEYWADPEMSWNPCTGLGSPDGVMLLSALQELLSQLERSRVAGLEAAEALLG